MMVFGITGGSGSGKTTACMALRSLGVEIIDADIIAREVVEKGSKCLDELVTHFGADILQPDGSLDRSGLAEIAFADAKKTALLGEITHKYIHERIKALLNKSQSPLTAIDGAVLIDSPIENECEFIVSVIADREIRLERIMNRDGITREQAQKRLDAQPDDAFYRAHSRYILTNNGSAEELCLQAEQLYNKINEV